MEPPDGQESGAAIGWTLVGSGGSRSVWGTMETVIFRFAGLAEQLTEIAAIAVVTYGVVEASVRLLRVMVRPGASHGERKAVWRRLGVWLLLGLEFELAADIIGSIASPSWQDIGQLGAIAAIRTFVNYFLEQDLERASGSDPANA